MASEVCLFLVHVWILEAIQNQLLFHLQNGVKPAKRSRFDMMEPPSSSSPVPNQEQVEEVIANARKALGEKIRQNVRPICLISFVTVCFYYLEYFAIAGKFFST